MLQMPTIDMVKTGQNIMNLRQQAGLSVKDLQDIFGFATPQAIYKWRLLFFRFTTIINNYEIFMRYHNGRITMYRVAICDDENEILNDISKRIKACFEEKNISAEYVCMNDPRKLMECLQTEKVDVLFLDIDMPYFSGMDIAGFVNENGLQTMLVFVTSHDALVYQTFAYRPFGFIRKTHIADEIGELSDRIKKELLDRKQELVIEKGQELIRIPIQDIIYIESEGNYLNIFEKNTTHRVRETMRNMENELSGKGFIRCHKGYLIHVEYIEKFRSSEVEMRWGQEHTVIPVGRSYEKDVKKKILEWV